MSTRNTILFLNENPLPAIFTKGTISGKELRLRSAIKDIDQVHVVSRRGQYLASNDQSRGELEKKVHIHLLPPWPYLLSSIPLFFVGLYQAIRFRPILIEAESPILSGPAAILIGKLTQTPVLIEVRASYKELLSHRLQLIPLKLKQLLLNLVQNFSLQNASVTIANSKHYQNKLNQVNIKSSVINPGLQYPPDPNKTISKKKHLTIGFIGRLVPEKGVDLLIDAVSILRSDPTIPTFQLEISGIGSQEKLLKHQVNHLNLSSDITFLGFTPNYSTIAKWDIMVNPNTINHPLEMVNAEAAYAGVPVVCFGDKNTPETVIHHQTGIKVSTISSASLARSIKTLLLDSKLRAKMSNNSHHFAVKNYRFTNQVKKLAQLYSSQKII